MAFVEQGTDSLKSMANNPKWHPGIGVCFDFDGTLGDTETPAMEVAYWEIAPYLVPPIPTAEEFIRLNAGKAFELMVEACDKERAEHGLAPIAQVRPVHGERLDIETLEIVNSGRRKFGLKSFDDSCDTDLITLQKNDTVVALAKTAKAVDGVIDTLEELDRIRVPYNIATTSGAPRVLASRDASGLSRFFPDQNVHSGETDFTPAKFKPDPAVYHKACKAHGLPNWRCISIEDSGSGVGSAANANMGLIIGFVGASHVKPDARDKHAKMLMSGARSEDRRGAELVVSKFYDILPIVKLFMKCLEEEKGEQKSGDVISIVRRKVVECARELGLSEPFWLSER